ncbi:DNA alkylation repair protein [Falsirhodobacter sp. alg1]|uniref:DNA alkylation repair protein n=1 Tax=Falsirhodobacter sp. alg1 TaxID=1472418 RepID=UPI0007872705|nr:DNA alkylation repair protein [Falsirhodobacter sp. alg1]
MTYIETLRSKANDAKAIEALEYHKTERVYLGIALEDLEALVAEWRENLTIEERVSLAQELWESDIHDARIAAAKLLLQARMRPDDSAWDAICIWVEELDNWAIADAVAKSAEKRVMADFTRFEALESWLQSKNSWARRTAILASRPLAKKNHIKPAEREARDAALDLMVDVLGDRNWHVQKAIASWLRDLAKHDAVLARQFIAEYGEVMRGYTRKDAAQNL